MCVEGGGWGGGASVLCVEGGGGGGDGMGKRSPIIGCHLNGEHFILVSFHHGIAHFWHHMSDGCFTALDRIGVTSNRPQCPGPSCSN